ncbi:helix-turn-helix transcriptional regulator [Alteromonas ponticola]|uniref:Helix-turn-helix transcriptional regulator n=1 Tax=Alteromonas aquimaris TaxID=2998417 RepID=A0ABT3P2X5_9ALTE|nr:helix-turn-helix transcriptional regulator [Alteromonas aquimaris]MCW8107127.1 helix-turn-helix transcriptional regulator [Alteromonas aquimaris]
MINNYLKHCREALMSEHGRQTYSQVAVADKLSVSKSYISRVENGTETPSRDFLVRISQVYNIDEDITLAIGGYLSPKITALFSQEPRCMLLIRDLCELNDRQLAALFQDFEDNEKIEFLSKLGKNRLLSQIVSNLLVFDTQELNDLIDTLQDYTKQPLHFD